MKKILIIITVILVLGLSWCNSVGYKYSDISFSLKTDTDGVVIADIPSSIQLITSEEELSSYLSSEYFSDDLSSNFIAENTKCDEEFFNDHDLIAIIYHATSGSIKAVKINSVKIDNNEIVVILKTSTEDDIGTDDMGRYFTFYVVINKLDQAIDLISYQVK